MMKVYCAETGGLRGYVADNPTNTELPKFNILFSYYYTKDVSPYLSYAKSIIVDSGGFSFQTNPKCNLKHETYFKEYKEFIEQNHELDVVDGFFELDIDNLTGYDVVKEYREELFEITDKIIPVWHKSLGVEEYKCLCDEYDFIAIPCVNDNALKPESYYKFVKYAHNHNCKVHGLGMLRSKILNKVPFDTVDGTSWFLMNRFGKYKGKKVNSDYLRNNPHDMLYIELMEHIRFQNEMYNKWKFYHND